MKKHTAASKKRVVAMLGAAVVFPTAAAQAALTGFSGFAPVNKTITDAGTASTDANIGYTNSNSSFELTDGQNAESTSGFATAAQTVGTSWTATFTYQQTLNVYSGNQSAGTANYVAADGFDFVLQNDTRGTAALGGDGGARGYGAPPGANTNTALSSITPSASIQVDNFGGFLSYGGAVGYNVNGASTTPNGLGTVSIANGTTGSSGTATPVNITYSYNAAAQQLKETFVNTSQTHGDNTTSTYVHLDTGVNLASVLGSNTARVGFTGGSGGFSSTESVSNFNFTNVTVAAPVTAPANATYAPIPLATSSFNQAIVVPAVASGQGTATQNQVDNFLTATMDDGASQSILTGTGYTWFEKGFVASSTTTPSNASAGLPTSGSTFTSAADARHSFTMPAYTSGGNAINNAVLLDDGDNGDGTSATLAFTTPKAFAALSFLTATGNGPGLFTVTVNYSNGSTYAVPGDVISGDWFSGPGTIAYATGGRYETDNNTYNITTNGDPNLYQVDVGLADTTDAIKSVTVTYDGGDRSELAIFALSGGTAPVPEPASIGLLAFAGVGLAARRRQRR